MTLLRRVRDGWFQACLIGVVALTHYVPVAVGNDSVGTQKAVADMTVKGEFSSSVQRCLLIPDTGAEVLPQIANVLKVLDNAPSVQAPVLNKLVDALLAGPHPTVLIAEIHRVLNVNYTSGAQVGIPDWKYGSAVQKIELINILWNLAETAQEKSPERSRQIARAALMLAALNDFEGGWIALRKVCSNESDTAKTLLNLPDDDFEKLQEVVKARMIQLKLGTAEDEAAMREIDLISASKDSTVSLEKVKVVLAHEDNAWREGPAQLGNRHWIIGNAWDFLNLLRFKQSQEGQSLVRKQLEIWKQEFPDPDTSRWIDEALTRVGPPPGKMLNEYVMDPDGKLRLVDPNK